jgi:FkbM family methyltransferase
MNINNFDVLLIEKGVSNFTGQKVFYDVEGSHQTSASLDPNKLKNFKNFEGKIREYQIETIRLDDFCKKNNLLPDLIKIDVELHEPEVIEGMGDFLKDCSAAIIIEVLTNEVADKLNEILKESKFQFYSLEKDSIELVSELIPKNNIYNYLLLPEGKFINEVV